MAKWLDLRGALRSDLEILAQVALYGLVVVLAIKFAPKPQG